MNIYPPKVSSRLLVIERLYFYDESLILWKLLSCLDCCCLFVWSFTESKRLRGAASTRQRGRRPVQRTLVHPAGEVSPEITTRRTCRCPLRPRFSFVLRNNRERKTKRRCPNFTRSRESGSRLPLDLLERKVTRVGFLLFFLGTGSSSYWHLLSPLGSTGEKAGNVPEEELSSKMVRNRWKVE